MLGEGAEAREREWGTFGGEIVNGLELVTSRVQLEFKRLFALLLGRVLKLGVHGRDALVEGGDLSEIESGRAMKRH